MVPLGVGNPGGIKLAVYTKEQWEKAAKNEQVEHKELKPVDLKFSHCLRRLHGRNRSHARRSSNR